MIKGICIISTPLHVHSIEIRLFGKTVFGPVVVAVASNGERTITIDQLNEIELIGKASERFEKELKRVVLPVPEPLNLFQSRQDLVKRQPWRKHRKEKWL